MPKSLPFFARKTSTGVEGESHNIGENVLVIVRPEDMRISRDLYTSRGNVLVGKVTSTVFLGPISRIHIRIGDRLLMLEQTGSDSALPELDAEVRLEVVSLSVISLHEQ